MEAKTTSANLDSCAREAEMVFEFWRQALGHARAKFTPDRRRKVEARLREGYSQEMICQAIIGITRSEYHMGRNDDGIVYDDLELICRSGRYVERFARMAKRQPLSHLSPAGRRTAHNAQTFIEEMQRGKAARSE